VRGKENKKKASWPKSFTRFRKPDRSDNSEGGYHRRTEFQLFRIANELQYKMSLPDEKTDEALEAELRQRANDSLPLLDCLDDWKTTRSTGAGDSRAFVIEVAGLPKAGKTKAIDNVRHYFTYGSRTRVKVIDRPYRIYTPSEGVSQRTPGYLKDNLLDYNCWAGAYALQKLLEANHDSYHDLVVLDRGPWDTGCWIEYLRTEKASLFPSVDQASKIGDFFQLSHWMTQSDLHVVLVVDPTLAASREKSGRLIEHQGTASKQDLMEAMHKIYQERFVDLQLTKAKECPYVGTKAAILIDTTSKRPLEVAWEVIEAVFAVLKSKIAYRDKFTVVELKQRLIKSRIVPPRQEQVVILRSWMPGFVKRANGLDSSQRGRLRDKLTSISPETDGNQIDLFAAQLDAKSVIEDVEKMLTSLVDEEVED
jgi:hypothetical protein